MVPGNGPWRQPVMWLVVALPVGAVLASAILIAMAIRSGGDDAVADPVRRTAQIQETELSPDASAQRMGLSAVLRIEPGLLELLPATGEFDRAAPLLLNIRHPTRAREDILVRLAPSANGWRSSQHVANDHDWRVQLQPVDGAWRILGRLPKGQRATRLAPALESP